MTITIELGPTTTPRANFIAEAQLPLSARTDGAWRIVDTEAGDAVPAQIDDVGGTPRVAWHVKELAPGEKRLYELRPADEPAKDRGIALHDQPENGRLVVYYGGLLQTIYHYGMPHYRPYYAPNVAPSGRAGSGVLSTDGSQPKSITDNGPPDHTWHRSLRYACGDLNGVDFYLEPAAMQEGYGPHVGTGWGRIVHRSFDWQVSGPVWGGFQQRAQWVAPDGAILLDDVRRFRMYRTRGRMRLWDIEAEFTPHSSAGAVTFGQLTFSSIAATSSRSSSSPQECA